MTLQFARGYILDIDTLKWLMIASEGFHHISVEWAAWPGTGRDRQRQGVTELRRRRIHIRSCKTVTSWIKSSTERLGRPSIDIAEWPFDVFNYTKWHESSSFIIIAASIKTEWMCTLVINLCDFILMVWQNRYQLIL